MNQINYVNFTLENVALSATLIVEGTRLAAGESEDSLFTFDIAGSYGPKSKALKTGQRIRVWNAGEADYAKGTGLSKHALVRVFDLNNKKSITLSSCKPGRNYILFLNNIHNDEFVLTVENAIIVPQRFDEIRNIVADLRWKGQAVNAEFGAALKADGMLIYIDSLKTWPSNQINSSVEAVGLLVWKKYNPNVKKGKIGSQDTVTRQWVLEKPCWRFL